MDKKTFSFIVFLYGAFLSTISGAEIFLKHPVPSKTVIHEKNGQLMIDCSFSPTRLINQQKNDKINYRYAERICRDAIRQYLYKDSAAISIRGLSVAPDVRIIEKKIHYRFSVLKKNVLSIDRPSKNKTTYVKRKAITQVKAKKETVRISADRGISKPQKETNNNSQISLTSHSILTEKDLAKYELTGYFIRYKTDIATSFLDTFEEIKNLKIDDSYFDKLLFHAETLCKDEKDFIRNIKLDGKLLGSETKQLMLLFSQKKQELLTYISSQGIRQIDQVLHGYAEQLDSLEKEKKKSDSNMAAEINKDIQEVKSEITRHTKLRDKFSKLNGL